MALLLAKGDDFTAWRGVEEFAVAYRDAAVSLASSFCPRGIPQLLELLEDRLIGLEQQNRQTADRFCSLCDQLQEAIEPESLRQRFQDIYDLATEQFRQFRSPVAFFSQSTRLMQLFAERCLQLVVQQLDQPPPPCCLLAMGPAGRQEATRFCRIQLALVWHPESGADQLMHQVGDALDAWFRVCGIPLEEGSNSWRGSLADWRERFEQAIAGRNRESLIDLLRLADRTVLTGSKELAAAFSELCNGYLPRRQLISNLVERCTALTNGIGLMGNLKLEKGGPHRGRFSLLDHALLPLAASVAAISLMHGVRSVGTPARLRELVRIGKLDVDLAERSLHAWYCFSGHRLILEQQALTGMDCRDILQLLPSDLSAEDLEQLRHSLETVGDLQRYMQVCFGAYT